MVFFLLGHLRDRVDEIDRVLEIIELKGPLDMLLLQFPLRDFFHPLLQLACFNQVGHNGRTSNTRKSFCNAESRVFLPQSFRAKSMNPVAELLGSSAGSFDSASLRSG